MKQIITFLLLIVMSISANAAVDVTYSFDQQNVKVLAVDCLNDVCSSTQNFSGNITKGPIVSDGSVILRYPDSLATQDGYAEFFVSPSFRPLVGRHYWHTFGMPGINTTSQSANFTKMPNICMATVSQLNLVNSVKPNLPVSIETNASLDALTASAFRMMNTGVSYIPSELLQEFWGADTVVLLEILNGTNVINRQEKYFIAANNNAIIADTTVPVTFVFTPTIEGNFTARVSANVVDNQCSAQETQSASSFFAVANPNSRFYSILNNLGVNNIHPEVGDTVVVSFNKISNHVTNDGNLTAVGSRADFFVELGNTNIVSSVNNFLPANIDVVNPAVHSFNFTPISEGSYNISVRIRTDSQLPAAQPEIFGEQSFVLYVGPVTPPTVSPISVVVSPQTNFHMNYSFFPISAQTNIVASCNWGFDDVSRNLMQNNFNTIDGLAHTSQVYGLLLGNNAVHVACNNQTATDNVDLTFVVENILDGSSLSGNNHIVNSKVINSVIFNSNITNSFVNNSTISGFVVNNANITNNIFYSGEIWVNGIFYNFSAGNSFPLSKFVPAAPVANFLPLSATIFTGQSVVFNSTSTDEDIGGPLNDFLTFFWNFGDNSNSTLSFVNKTFATPGIFNVTLAVQDKFGFLSSKNEIITVLAVNNNTNSSNNNSSSAGNTGIIDLHSSRSSRKITDSVVQVPAFVPAKQSVVVQAEEKTVASEQVQNAVTPVQVTEKQRDNSSNNFRIVELLLFADIIFVGVAGVLLFYIFKKKV